ncbi:MAG: Gfo/Idh/MocA family oxidoreductase [Rhizobiaceae bacterium]|nr:Gfo/Idh/MocA family oxidoreductase [Rhizobiaceae bacterium]
MNQKLRIGVVGCGSMGANHARIARDLPGASLVGVVDHHAEKSAAVAERSGTAAFETVDALLDAGIDAAIVATPTIHHHAVASRLLNAGVHVLLEKPIASTVEEARDLVETAERCARRLAIGHVERYNPAVMALKQAVKGKDIRQISIVRAGPFPARIGDVGIVLDLGVHDIDLVRWLAEAEIAKTASLTARTLGAHEDQAFLQFRMTTGALAAIGTNWLTPFRRRTLEIATTDRFYVCDMLLRTLVEHFDYGTDGSFRQRPLFVAQSEPLRSEQLAFLAAIRGEGEAIVSGQDGLRSLEVALGCLGGAPM